MFISEERRIVERVKEYIKKKEPRGYCYVMLRNGCILDVDDYRKMVDSGKITPQDAYVYIKIYLEENKISFYYPFLDLYGYFLDAYLSKLGFLYQPPVVPATGLKYVVFTSRYDNYLSIELVNLDVAVDNTNIRKIVFEAMSGKIISKEKKLTVEEYYGILEMFRSQKLFAGYDFGKVRLIIFNYYYNENNKPPVKEVARITMDYYRIFQPYRVCYDMRTWKEIDCSSINLD